MWVGEVGVFAEVFAGFGDAFGGFVAVAAGGEDSCEDCEVAGGD